jgi:hypothetical protein
VFTPFHKPPYPYPYGRSVDETTTGATARVFGATSGLKGARAAGSEDSNDRACAGISSIVLAAASRVSSWLGGSEDALAAATSPAAISLMAGEDAVASAEGASPACVGSASVAAARLEAAFAGAFGRAGSSALASLVTSSNRGERRSSSARPRSPPASSLRALLFHGRSGAEVTASPEAGAGAGCVTRSMEMGYL